jgi:hypothetical protein
LRSVGLLYEIARTKFKVDLDDRFVGALADRVFVPHAAPNSRTLALCNELRAAGKQILSITDLETHFPAQNMPNPRIETAGT